MCKVKLIKGLSYTGYGVHATVESPCADVEKKEVADALVASGYFSVIDTGAHTDDGKNGAGKPLDKMTEKELEAYAAENGIDLSGASKKAEKLAAIQQALAEDDGNGADLFDDED